MKANRLLRVGAALLGMVALALFPIAIANPYYIHLLETIMIYAILLFGLDIVVGYTGQVSLGHAGLFGIGAYTAGVLVMKLGTPVLVTLTAAIGVTAFFGALLALPALRVTGPYLAMVTLAFGTIVQILINEMSFLTEGPLGIKLTKPVLFGLQLDERSFFWLVAALLVLSLVFVHNILRSHLGRAFEALRGSPVACDCMGVSVYRYKVYAFVISAGFAGLAGSLYAFSEQYISPNTYNFELTVLFLLAVIMGGRKTRTGAMLGATIIVLLPKLLDDLELFRYVSVSLAVLVAIVAVVAVRRGKRTARQMVVPVLGSLALAGVSFVLQTMTDWRLSIFGVITLFVVYYLQDGIVGFVRDALNLKRRAGAIDVPASSPERDALATTAQTGTGGTILEAGKVLMQFGGLKALNDVDLVVQRGTIHGLIGPNGSGKSTIAFAGRSVVGRSSSDIALSGIARTFQNVQLFGGLKALADVDLVVKRGTIHGLIGPNGSGKSTMMNVLTGIYVPTAGTIAFAGRSVVGRSSSDIALSGIARTFQNVQLFGEMTALQNVLVGLHHTFRSNLFGVALTLPRYRRERAAAIARALGLLEFVGLGAFAGEEARNLPYGKQRLLEIARALALDPELLLLDEPAAGLTAPDIREMLVFIRKIREHGVTVILIEHHMDVVMSMCDTVSVLDFGQKIAEGTPAQVQADPKVVEAYLGGDVAEAHAT